MSTLSRPFSLAWVMMIFFFFCFFFFSFLGARMCIGDPSIVSVCQVAESEAASSSKSPPSRPSGLHSRLTVFSGRVLEQYRVFPQYRIQPGKWPKNSDYVKTLKNIFQNYIVVILPMCFVAPPVLEFLGISAYAPLPTWQRLVVDLVFCLLVEDLFQYLFHRLLHLPSLYPLIHKYVSVFLSGRKQI